MFDLGADIVNSRDIEVRRKELEAFSELDESERDELNLLSTICMEGSSLFLEWEEGVTLVRDSYFEDYAYEVATDYGLISTNSWPCNYIDWEGAAKALKMDYTSIELDGVTYYGRE